MIALNGKNVLVVGLGVTGESVARFLKHRDAVVTITDRLNEEELVPIVAPLRAEGIEMELGIHRSPTFEKADLIVLSPGVSHNLPPILAAKEKGIPVWGETEFASQFIREPLVAVTGTNGKTTTTRLLSDMLSCSGLKVFLGGNIGNPLINYVAEGKAADIVVAELSSFQLDTIETFCPKVGVLLNVTEDHMDRYPDFEDYIEAKIRLFRNQSENDVAVLNGADPVVQKNSARIHSKKLFFDASESTDACATIVNRRIRLNLDRFPSKIREAAGYSNSKTGKHQATYISGPKLYGNHNLENTAAACLAALAAGGTLEGVQIAADEFKGLSHRLEYVDTVQGVGYYDDSKATNVGAVIRAIETFDRPVVLIMGGQNKGGHFEPLIKPLSRRVKILIAIGEAKNEILSVLGHACGDYKAADSMEEAVWAAYRESKPGDVVLLSPACASFDMYRNYAQRGEDFARAVKNLRNIGP